ncbi:MAG: ribokinase, partial [Anaerolineales bacterium]|nr:ribokinase [Anaerolineales bacterium]
MADIIVVGSLNMDTVANLEKLPSPGETVHGLKLQKFPGGKGANQATALARLGNKVSLVGMVGDDEDGRILRQRLVDEGVDANNVIAQEGKHTGSAIIMVDRGGNNEIIVFGGANGEVNIPFIEQRQRAFSGAKFLL